MTLLAEQREGHLAFNTPAAVVTVGSVLDVQIRLSVVLVAFCVLSVLIKPL